MTTYYQLAAAARRGDIPSADALLRARRRFSAERGLPRTISELGYWLQGGDLTDLSGRRH